MSGDGSARAAREGGPPGPLSALVSGPRAARTLAALAVAVAVAGVCAVVGTGPWRAVTVAAAVAGVGLVVAALPAQRRVSWPVEPATVAEGARTDLIGLAVALKARRGGVAQAGLTRVQAAGRARLRRRGLDLDRPADRPAIEQLIGAAATQVLLAPPSAAPAVRAVEDCVARLEALPPPGARTRETPAEVPTEGPTAATSGRGAEDA